MIDPAMPPRIGQVLETALYANDLATSVEFYQRVLGFTPTSDPEGRLCAMDVTADQVLLICQRGASVNVTVTPYGNVPPHDGEGSLHVAFAIPESDFDAWHTHLESSGIEVESVVSWPNGGRSIYFRDPDAHCVELKTSNWHGGEPAFQGAPPS
jgi:catechol 2,3-dioxygenase-like lactoylglutathione lyase family enzyme